ncbi:MAG: hypothetical protein GY715_12640 [Planctomycetes bacterium]|nr:hypothetical protein [Planctomycetota bacterium]
MRATALSLILAATAVFLAGCAQTTRAGTDPVAVRPSITIFPVQMAGQGRDDVAKVVALALEQRGMESIEVDETVFTPEAGASFDSAAAAFGAFVAKRDLATDYALFAAIVGAPQRGVDEIHAVLVDRRGNVAWSDRQTRESRAMKKARPSNPMECTMFLVERLHDPLDLGEPNEDTEGRWARHWRSDSLAPTDAERDAIDARAKRLRRAGSSATVLVYPARVGDTYSRECATRLADEINRRGLLDASIAEVPIEFEVEMARNQQKVLWSGARSIQEHVRASHPQTDYVLVADYLFPGGADRVWAVHTFLLESDGDWVMVDFQNSHHDDFNRIGPKSPGDCCDLSVKRLSRHLRS